MGEEVAWACSNRDVCRSKELVEQSSSKMSLACSTSIDHGWC